MSVRDGYGPIVSLGVTTQAPLLLAGAVSPVEVDAAEGAVGESEHAAAAAAAYPMAPSAARRLSALPELFRPSFIVPSVMKNTVPRRCWETLSAG
jgi:hypothetical protein